MAPLLHLPDDVFIKIWAFLYAPSSLALVCKATYDVFKRTEFQIACEIAGGWARVPPRFNAESLFLAFVHARCAVMTPGKLRLSCRGIRVPFDLAARQVSVSESQAHSYVLVLDANGCVWSMGDNEFGGLGRVDAATDLYKLHPIESLCNVRSVFASCGSSAAITRQSELWVWGRLHDCAVPRRLVLPEPVAHVALSDEFMLVVSWDGCSVYGVGNNECYQLGLPDKRVYPQLVPVPHKRSTTRVIKAAAGRYHALLLLNNGWVLGSGLMSDILVGGFTRVVEHCPVAVKDVQACNLTTAILCRNGDLYACGYNSAWGHLFALTHVFGRVVNVQVTAMNGVFFVTQDGRVGQFRSSPNNRARQCIQWAPEKQHVLVVQTSSKFWACIG